MRTKYIFFIGKQFCLLPASVQAHKFMNKNTFMGISRLLFYRYILNFQIDCFKLHLSITMMYRSCRDKAHL